METKSCKLTKNVKCTLGKCFYGVSIGESLKQIQDYSWDKLEFVNLSSWQIEPENVCTLYMHQKKFSFVINVCFL